MKKLLSIFCLIFIGTTGFAQTDDLLNILDSATPKTTTYTNATFKGTRLISGHSNETVKAKHLDFLISHRFGRLNTGMAEFFGLDQASVRLGLEYGLSDRFTVGIGRSGYQKTVDMFVKGKLLRQSSGARNMPFSVTFLASNAYVTEPTRLNANSTIYTNNAERQNFTGQFIITRKFSNAVSVLIAPTVMQLGKVEGTMPEMIPAIGFGGRVKVSKRISLNGEYYARILKGTDLNTAPNAGRAYDAFALGVDIETGGHVFQLHFTNSLGMVEKQFIAQTLGTWAKGDIHYGFNISRMFSFDKSVKKKIKE